MPERGSGTWTSASWRPTTWATGPPNFAEGMKTAFSGWVHLNGEEYIVRPEDCFDDADKNWGGDFTFPWVWLSSNDLVSNVTGKRLANSVFEVGGGNPKAFGIALGQKLLGQFYYEG